MSEADGPIDRRMAPRDRASVARSRKWRPSPLGWGFLVVTGLDALILLIAFGVRSTDSDAAGNGMVNAFQTAFVEVGTVTVAILALLFLLIKHRSTRIVLTVLLALVTLFLLTLLT